MSYVYICPSPTRTALESDEDASSLQGKARLYYFSYNLPSADLFFFFFLNSTSAATDEKSTPEQQQILETSVPEKDSEVVTLQKRVQALEQEFKKAQKQSSEYVLAYRNQGNYANPSPPALVLRRSLPLHIAHSEPTLSL